MDEVLIKEGNKLIAEFMDASTPSVDYPYKVNNQHWKIEGLKYHSSWDWLMPVIEKIENLGLRISITEDYCEVFQKTNNSLPIVKKCCSPKIEATWLTVIEFIRWRNQ